jgi:hypothetical protein
MNGEATVSEKRRCSLVASVPAIPLAEPIRCDQKDGALATARNPFERWDRATLPFEDREDCSLAARAIFTAIVRASPEPCLIDPATETEIAEAVTLIGETRPSDCEPG